MTSIVDLLLWKKPHKIIVTIISRNNTTREFDNAHIRYPDLEVVNSDASKYGKAVQRLKRVKTMLQSILSDIFFFIFLLCTAAF